MKHAYSFVFGLLSLGLTFSLNAVAESPKTPIMSAEAGDDISGSVERVVRVDNQKTDGTTTASASDVGAKKKKWTVGFLSENGVTPNQGHTYFSQNNINVSYDLGQDRSIQVRQYFLYNMTNQDYGYEWTQGDTALQYSDAGHKIGSADNLFIARLYVPGAYYNEQVGKYELRLYNVVTQGVNKYVDVTYFIDPRFYTYTQTDAAQTGFQNLLGITATYASKSAFATPFTTVYAQDLWGNTGKGVGLIYNGAAGVDNYSAVNQDYLNVDVGTNLNFTKTFSATLFYEYTNNVRALNTSQPLDNGLSSWNLWVSASL